MNWTEFLSDRIEDVYRATEGLIGMVEADQLGWKPEGGDNWMTTGQLLKHLENACGWCCRGFVTGDWSPPAGAEMLEAEMLPSAEQLPSSTSVEASLAALAADQQDALAMIAKAGEEAMGSQQVSAPWDPVERPLGFQLHECVEHLAAHKSQLFYYLKLQGKPVHTGTLRGITM